MIGDWSQEIRREYAGSNARFEFPVRPLGKGRLIGVFLVLFGLLFVWFPGKTAWQSIEKLHQHGPDLGNLIFGLFPLIFVVAGCWPIGIGLLILFGRSRVEWKDGQVRAAEILGPLRWTRRLPRKPIRKLEVAAATATATGEATVPRQFENFSGLAVVFEDGSKKLVVLGYPKDWLLAVAGELKTYVGGETAASTSANVEVVAVTAQNESDDDVLEQPAGSRVQITESAGGIRLSVPPAGVWRGSAGFFFFSLVWCGFMTVITTMVLLPGSKRTASVSLIVLIFSGFWAIGLAMMAFAINVGRRTAEFVVESGCLRVETKGLFGTKQREWSRDEIAAVRADRSGMEVNHRPVIELQVHPRTGKKAGFLAGRNETELRWLATRLRRALNVPARKTES
jgi:hypothetical protein